MDKYNEGIDKYDALMGAFIGLSCGAMDVFGINKPGAGAIGKFTDEMTNKLVMQFAKSVNKLNGDKSKVDTMQNAMQFLERHCKINYDQAKGEDTDYMVNKMIPANHHLKSLGHCPDIIGLFFSILDQFQGKSSFLNNGSLIRINSEFELEGNNFISKIYAGFCNWIGHIMSDIAGSNTSAGKGNRGSGVPIPFFELFNLCNFGEFGQYRQPLSTIMVQVFEKGYDYRHGLAMAIPVVTNDVMTMGSWCFKRKFYHKWEWKECIPSDEYKSFRRTRLISNGALCLVDGTHAYIKGHGNPIEVILRMNLFAWLNLVRLIIKELLIAYGRTYEDLINDLRIIEEALNNELSKLKSYDYQAWQTENNKNKEFNRALLLSGDNIDNVGNIVNDYIFSNNVNLNYKNFDEFENIFRNNGQLF